MADVTGLDVLGIPVYQAVRPASRNLSVSQGKALTRAGARVSAVMESLELWHAESLAHLVQVTSPLREMRYANAIPVESLKWRRDTILYDGAPMTWVAARSLTRDRDAWLPRAMLELDYSFPDRFRPSSFHVTSNGLASGNSREEALVHSLCELIERHALFLAARDPAHRVPLDPATIRHSECRAILERLQETGMRCAIYDITWEVGLAVVTADLVAPDLPSIWRGAGCHPDPAVALSRALTEAAQSRLTYISGARDDLTQFADGANATLLHERFRVPTPRRAFDALPQLASGDLHEDLARILAALDHVGLEPFAVDITRAEMGVPVMICFVPGLREGHYG